MSYETALARIAQITQPLATTAAQVGAVQAPDALAPQGAGFAGQLAQASAALPVTGGTVGERIVQLARQELAKGVHETNGNNDSPDIARYRTATAGAMPGAAWCAYFVSYLAKQAGAPIGPNGSGMGAVDGISAWAKQTGKWIPTSGQPQPGDLVFFNEHIGVVESVNSDGSVTTIEGNHSDKVDEVHRTRGEIVGFARL